MTTAKLFPTVRSIALIHGSETPVRSTSLGLSNNIITGIASFPLPPFHPPPRAPFCLCCLPSVLKILSEPLEVGYQAVLFNNSGKITFCTLTKVRNLISVFLTSVTLLTVTAMSVHPYLAIYLHLRYEQVVTVKRTRKVILCLWLIGSLPSVITDGF